MFLNFLAYVGRSFGKRKRFDTRLVQLRLWDCWYVVDLMPVSFYKFAGRICKVERGCEETVIIAESVVMCFGVPLILCCGNSELKKIGCFLI